MKQVKIFPLIKNCVFDVEELNLFLLEHDIYFMQTFASNRNVAIVVCYELLDDLEINNHLGIGMVRKQGEIIKSPCSSSLVLEDEDDA